MACQIHQVLADMLGETAGGLAVGRAPVGNRFSQLMQAYLADESLCRQTQGALEELNLSVSGALPVVLGTIAEVYKADSQASGGLSEQAADDDDIGLQPRVPHGFNQLLSAHAGHQEVGDQDVRTAFLDSPVYSLSNASASLLEINSSSAAL